MTPIRKYFTPPLTVYDREMLLDCFGLGGYRFTFLETSGPLLLRASDFAGTHRASRLTSLELTPEAWAELPLPKVRWNHELHQVGRDSLLREPSLWEELFPYPFSLFSAPTTARAECLQFEPLNLQQAWQEVARALMHLEEKLAQTELSCLWVKGQRQALPLLFHYVRGRRMRVGPSPILAELNQGEPPELRALQDYFRTSVALYVLDLANPEPIDALSRLTTAIFFLAESQILPPLKPLASHPFPDLPL